MQAVELKERGSNPWHRSCSFSVYRRGERSDTRRWIGGPGSLQQLPIPAPRLHALIFHIVDWIFHDSKLVRCLEFPSPILRVASKCEFAIYRPRGEFWETAGH